MKKVINYKVQKEEWEELKNKAFKKLNANTVVDGFRKGAVPKEVFLKKVGVEALFMDACDIAMQDAYKDAFKQADMEVVVEPSVNIEKVDKDGVVFAITFIGKPEVKLGDYKKLGVKREKVKVTDEEIEHEIEHLKSHLAEVVIKENGEVCEGNTAIIDFEGYMNGEKFDGGTGANYPLEIGSHTFIPGFEEGVVGMKAGETKDLELTFPEDYVKEMAGKDVTFKVTVREIKERVMPEVDADFFEDLGIEGVDSLDKLKEHLKKELTETKEAQAEDKYIDELLRKATDNMEVDINAEIIEGEVERMINQYSQELAMQGVTFEQYCQFTGTKIEDVKVMMKPQAIARIKTRYLLEEVAKVEKIEIKEDAVKEEIKTVSEKYGMSEDEFLAAIGGEEMVKYDLMMKAALEVVKEG